MATELWFEMLEKILTTDGLLQYLPPMLFHKDIKVLPFGPYDTGNGKWDFRTCFRFETFDPTLRRLYAMTMGSMFFFPAQSNQPARIVLKRGDSLGIGLLRHTGILPLRYPVPSYIIYENIDPEAARQAALDALTAGSRARTSAKLLKRRDPEFQPISMELLPGQLADLWLEGKIPDGLFVEGGETIGVCSADPNSVGFFMELRMVDSIDPLSTMFYNPSYHLALWQERGWMEGVEIFPELTDISNPPAGTGGVKTVSGGGPDQITSAIDSAFPGDTILILDNETYTDEIVVDQEKPFSITGVVAKDDFANHPKLNGKGNHRPVTVTNKTNVSNGIIYISRLIIENGEGTGDRNDGGGILIERADHTVISNCVIRGCTAPGTLKLLELFGEGFGGGIAIYHASPAILGCLIENNNAKGRGKGIGVFGYSWPTIVGCTIQNNGLNSSSGRKDGGGIGIEIAVNNIEDALKLVGTKKADLSTRWDDYLLEQAKNNYLRIVDSKILSNIAGDDGGGAYISVRSAVLMRGTTVSNNKATNNGGGIRLTMGSRLVTRQNCIIQNNDSNKDQIAMDKNGSGGGGLSVRNAALVDLAATTIKDNTAFGWAGGGVYFISSDEGTDKEAQAAGLEFDWNDILWDVFDLKKSILSIDASCSFTNNKATKLDGQGNHGKGGSLYVLRLLGPRGSGFSLPPDKEQNGLLKAPPIEVTIARASVLDSDNHADFADSHRLYLDDQTVPRVILDSDLSQAEASGKQAFSYPE